MSAKDYRDIIRQMEREMQQLSYETFRGFFDVTLGAAGRFWQPSVDIHETKTHLVVKMELAGAKADELQVSLSPDDRVLTISGARVETPADREGRIRCHQLEVYFGPFERVIGLPSVPVSRDEIAASYRDGFLLVSLPKRQTPEPPQTRVIPIKQSESETDPDPGATVRFAAEPSEGSEPIESEDK